MDKLTPENARRLDRATVQDIARARDFSKPIKPEEWGDGFPYSDVHLFYGPTNSFIGTKLKGKSKAERMSFMPILYKAIIHDLKGATARIFENGYYRDTRSVAKANLDLIKSIEHEISEASWP